MRMSVKDEIRAILLRSNFLHSLVSTAQSLNGLNPAHIEVAIAASKDVISRNQFRLLGSL